MIDNVVMRNRESGEEVVFNNVFSVGTDWAGEHYDIPMSYVYTRNGDELDEHAFLVADWECKINWAGKEGKTC